MTSFRSQSTAFIAPAPDDSDFLDSESERDINESLAEQEVEDYTHGIPSASQRSHKLTEMEAELAAVATPCASQTTTTSYFSKRQQQPLRPAAKIMQMTTNFSFTYFADPAPQADVLNQNKGRQAAGLPLDGEQLNQYLARAKRQQDSGTEVAPASSIAPHVAADSILHWFSIDSELVYLSFFDDWGPLNVAMFYRFCLHLHHLIGMMQEVSCYEGCQIRLVSNANLHLCLQLEQKATALAKKPEEAADIHLILYTTDQPRSKANAALLAAMYAMVCGEMTPADAYHPLHELELVAFRDAGYGRADFYLTIQDILYGVHRAMTENLLDLMTFDLDEYETYEQVQNGDWNWITPNIIAFASPNDREYVAELRDGGIANGRATPGLKRPLNAAFTKTIRYFKEKNIQLVVRLNNPLYDSRVFEREGIQHVDMYFDDGSNPSEEIVRDFIERANEVISRGGAIAVHCKAGLGRTGVLIGAYLAYKHGFTASESIGFMRIMRPGCVVGPQQHFMYKEACNWMRWREQDDAKKEMEKALAKLKVELVGTRRRKSDEIEENSSNDTDLEVDVGLGSSGFDERRHKKIKMGAEAPSTPKKRKDGLTSSTDEEAAQAMPNMLIKPTPCVGQPRKSPSPSRKRAQQAQAPATVARMGVLGNNSTRARLMSSSQRSLSGSSFTRNLQQVSQIQESQENAGLENNVSTTPRGSRVLGEAQRLNMQVAATDDGDMVLTTPRAGDWNAASQAKLNMEKNASSPSQRLKSKAVEIGDDGLFVEGWKSPEPPTTYTNQMSHSVSRPIAAIIPTPTTPTSPSTITQGVRASPHIREKFGLREAGSHQGTPRSRKEVSELPSSNSNGSTNSITPSSSLTSQDAPGSEDEQLIAGPLDTIRTIDKSVVPSDEMTGKTVAIPKQASRGPTSMNRKTSQEKHTTKIATTSKSRSASNTSSTSSRTVSGSSSGPASGNTRPASSTNVRRVITHGTSTTGRVAAVKDQLAQRQAVQPIQSDLSTRPSLKRLRSPELGTVSDAKAGPTTQSRTLVPSQIANKFGLGISSIGVAPLPSSKPTVIVPRFAAATAASAARNHQQQHHDSARIQRGGGPLYTASTKIIAGSGVALPLLATARLNGRNVRRRRSSIS